MRKKTPEGQRVKPLVDQCDCAYLAGITRGFNGS
jgi:hypothetical protein